MIHLMSGTDTDLMLMTRGCDIVQ